MASDPDKTKPKSSVVTTIIVVLLLTLIAAGAGLGVGAMLAPMPGTEQLAAVAATEETADNPATPPEKAAGHAAPAANDHGAPEPDAGVISAFEVPVPVPVEGPMVVIPLEPIITNLSAPQGVWLRIEASLLASKEHAQAPQTLAAEMGPAILAYIRTLKLSDIEGNSGFLAFRDDLDDLVQIASHGAARKVLVKSLVVE